MKPRFAPAVFLIVFCVSYIGGFAMDWPLFRYYPLHRDFSWGSGVLINAGPAMAWYGLMATAALVASIIAIIVPDRVFHRIHGLVWLFPAMSMVACGVLLRRFFG